MRPAPRVCPGTLSGARGTAGPSTHKLPKLGMPPSTARGWGGTDGEQARHREIHALQRPPVAEAAPDPGAQDEVQDRQQEALRVAAVRGIHVLPKGAGHEGRGRGAADCSSPGAGGRVFNSGGGAGRYSPMAGKKKAQLTGPPKSYRD